jgi:AraC-like DNA-binding protein
MKRNPSVPSGQSRTEGCYHLNRSFFASPRSFGAIRLIQLGRLYCKSNSAIAEHAHIDWFELTVATAGRGTVFTNGVAVPIVRGEIYLSFPWDHHAILSDEADPLKYDFFAFSVEDPDFSADLGAIMEENAAADRRVIRDEKIASLVSTAIAELDSARRHSEKLLSALFSEMMIRIVRGFSPEDAKKSPRSDAASVDALCYRLMHYIDTHIYSMESLEALSELTGYNYSYLSALFRRATSESLSSYYRRRRLETARLHIAENILSVTAIAELLRYSSIYTFSRAFKDAYGVSPENYRAQINSR